MNHQLSEGDLSAHDMYFGLIRAVRVTSKLLFDIAYRACRRAPEPAAVAHDRPVCFLRVRLNDYGWTSL